MHRVQFLLAWRYLRGNSRGNNISSMTIFCFSGIFIGTFALTLVVSIMNGFEKVTHEKLQGIHAQIVAHAKGNELAMDTIDPIIAHEFPAIAAWSPTTTKQVIIQNKNSNDLSHIIFIKGVDPIREAKVSTLENKIVAPLGQPSLSSVLEAHQLLIGKQLAHDMDLTVGDTVSLVINTQDQGSATTVTLEKKRATIGGIFSTGIEEFDNSLVLCSQQYMQTLYADSGITHINIQLHPGTNEETVVAGLRNRFQGISFYSWKDLYPALVAALKLEKYAMFFILALITLVASMNIISLLTLYITTKRGDIAILQSMGMSAQQISTLFFILGMIIALTASVTGLFSAFIVGWLLQRYPFITLPDTYYVTHLPIVLDWSLFLLVFCTVLGISITAIAIPIRAIRTMVVADILRFDR